ncbi:MAG: DUF5689 domain-containing protein [Nonlabens sp.]
MNNLSRLFAVMALAAITFSCVEDDDFAIPDSLDVEFVLPDNANLIDMTAVIGQIGQSAPDNFTYSNDPMDPELFMEGYVISSDQAGNYFEELIIQDAIADPTAGIKILIDDNPLFASYRVGQRVFVKLNGLTVGESNGVPVAGLIGDEFIEKIPAPLRSLVVFRDSEVLDIEPTVVTTPSEFPNVPLLTLVQVPNAQFATADVGRSFASEPTDQFDGVRFLQTCDDFFASPIRLETSTFSDFRGNRLFDGSGSVTAILQRDFRDDNYILAVNSLTDFDFDQSVRCNFDVVSCGPAAAAGTNNIIDEDFENVFSNPAEPSGWTNYVQEGTEAWEVFSDGDSLGRSVRASSFRSGDTSSIAWLITPQIDFDAQTGEVLSFETSNSFADSSEMQVLYSSDWDGTDAGVAAATWEPLADVAIVQNSDFFRNWIFSGNASLDCLNGTGHIAFKYEGNDTVPGSGTNGDFNGTYELDNISLTSD